MPVFRKESMPNAMYSGMVMGLAWTNYGGSTLMIETVKTESKVGGIKLTGRLGDVMKESANIAYTYVNSIKGDLSISKSFLKKYYSFAYSRRSYPKRWAFCRNYNS